MRIFIHTPNALPHNAAIALAGTSVRTGDRGRAAASGFARASVARPPGPGRGLHGGRECRPRPPRHGRAPAERKGPRRTSCRRTFFSARRGLDAPLPGLFRREVDEARPCFAAPAARQAYPSPPRERHSGIVPKRSEGAMSGTHSVTARTPRVPRPPRRRTGRWLTAGNRPLTPPRAAASTARTLRRPRPSPASRAARRGACRRVRRRHA